MATNSSPSDCAVRILDAVPPTTWFIRREMRRHRKGLSIVQFRALYFINANPAASLSSVAEHLGASLPSTSRLVAGLESRNLVMRSASKDDRRLIKLKITAQGRVVMDGARGAALMRIDHCLMALDDKQRVSLGKAMILLKKIIDPASNVEGRLVGEISPRSA